MPMYDYHCRSCGAEFARKEKIAEHGAHEVRCPTCGSREVERVIAPAYPRTARKS